MMERLGQLAEGVTNLGLEARRRPPELRHRLSERTGGVGKPLRPEHDQRHDENDENLREADAAHGASLRPEGASTPHLWRRRAGAGPAYRCEERALTGRRRTPAGRVRASKTQSAKPAVRSTAIAAGVTGGGPRRRSPSDDRSSRP